MNRAMIRGFVVVVAAAVVAPALAGEGRIPIWQPITIVPGGEGKYILTRDIRAAAGQEAISIQPGVQNVDIDLNGFTAFGSDRDVIFALGVDSVTVRNGTVWGGTGDGIHVEDGRKVVIEDVKAQFNGGDGFEVKSVMNFALRRNIVHEASGIGIFVDGLPLLPQTPDGTIEDNLMRQCSDGIVLISGSSVGIKNNRVEATLNDGIRANECLACLIEGNTVRDAGTMGLAVDVSRSCKIYNNVIHASGAEGILLVQTDDTLILNNVSSHNGANGFATDGNKNLIDRNVLNNNGLAGIWVTGAGTDNAYGRNTTQWNVAFPAAGACTSTPAPCVAPQVCIDVPGNKSFSDNMGPVPGC